jgi:hypothetical protein
VHQLVAITLKDSVDPFRSLDWEGILEFAVRCTTFPCMNALWDVKCTSDIRAIQVICHWIFWNGDFSCWFEQGIMLNPGCILFKGDSTLVSFLFTIDFNFTKRLRLKLSLLRLSRVTIGSSENIIGV